MQCLLGGYATWWNLRYQRTGHVFQGRFRGHLVEDEKYFWVVSRYVHLNPVPVLVNAPEAWKWSSYAGYLDPERRLPWIGVPPLRGIGREPALVVPVRARHRRMDPGIDAVRGSRAGAYFPEQRTARGQTSSPPEKPDGRSNPADRLRGTGIGQVRHLGLRQSASCSGDFCLSGSPTHRCDLASTC